MQDACAQLERAIGDGSDEVFEDLYNQLLNEISELKEAIEKKLSTDTA